MLAPPPSEILDPPLRCTPHILILLFVHGYAHVQGYHDNNHNIWNAWYALKLVITEVFKIQ